MRIYFKMAGSIASAKSRQYCFVRLWKRYDYRTVDANHHKKGKEYDVPVLIDPKDAIGQNIEVHMELPPI